MAKQTKSKKHWKDVHRPPPAPIIQSQEPVKPLEEDIATQIERATQLMNDMYRMFIALSFGGFIVFIIGFYSFLDTGVKGSFYYLGAVTMGTSPLCLGLALLHRRRIRNLSDPGGFEKDE